MYRLRNNYFRGSISHPFFRAKFAFVFAFINNPSTDWKEFTINRKKMALHACLSFVPHFFFLLLSFKAFKWPKCLDLNVTESWWRYRRCSMDNNGNLSNKFEKYWVLFFFPFVHRILWNQGFFSLLLCAVEFMVLDAPLTSHIIARPMDLCFGLYKYD